MRILLVIQNKKLASETSRKLIEQGDTVDILENGDIAFKFIVDYPSEFDLVVLDSKLPNIDGSSVCSLVRDEGIDIPILLLVTKEEVEKNKEILECGANDYLIKPFSFDELRLRSATLVERSAAYAPVAVTAGSVSLNVLERTLTKGKKTVTLTQKEFALLERFMRYPNKVFNRRELFADLWDEENMLSSNVVDVHIKNLREKLREVQEGSNEVSVETVRGVGYRLKIL